MADNPAPASTGETRMPGAVPLLGTALALLLVGCAIGAMFVWESLGCRVTGREFTARLTVCDDAKSYVLVPTEQTPQVAHCRQALAGCEAELSACEIEPPRKADAGPRL